MSREAIEEAIEVLEDASAEMLMETGDKNYYVEAIAVLRQALEEKQEPVAWTAMAFARLGEVRDKMRPDDVRIVQQFLDGDYTALEQTLETEPFEYWNAVEGWVKIDEVREHFDAVGCATIYKSAGEGRSPLYAAPQPALKTKYEQARSLTDELMDCVDRLGSEADTVDPRVWQHLLVYAPKHEKEPVAWADAIIDDLQGLFDTDGITEQDSGDALIRLSDAIAAVEDERKRYTAPQKQEPVAWLDPEENRSDEAFRWGQTEHHIVPLYKAPPKREWVGLTDEDIHDAFNFTEAVKQLSWDREPVRWCENFLAYIEAKLKEKNT